MSQFIPVTKQTRALFKLKDFPFQLTQYFHWFVGLNMLSSFWRDQECAQNTQLDNSPKEATLSTSSEGLVSVPPSAPLTESNSS